MQVGIKNRDVRRIYLLHRASYYGTPIGTNNRPTNGAISNDLEWPLTYISRSWYYSTSNNSKTMTVTVTHKLTLNSRSRRRTSTIELTHGLLHGVISNELERFWATASFSMTQIYGVVYQRLWSMDGAKPPTRAQVPVKWLVWWTIRI